MQRATCPPREFLGSSAGGLDKAGSFSLCAVQCDNNSMTAVILSRFSILDSVRFLPYERGP